jgi:hypothetical protein
MEQRFQYQNDAIPCDEQDCPLPNSAGIHSRQDCSLTKGNHVETQLFSLHLAMKRWENPWWDMEQRFQWRHFGLRISYVTFKVYPAHMPYSSFTSSA